MSILGNPLILGGSDPLKNAYAIIMVTFPAGATCTCSNGTKTYTAGNTYGGWAFGVNAAGDWTITITQGVKTRSQTVAVEEQYQVININMLFGIILFDNGDLGESGGFTAGSVGAQSYDFSVHAGYTYEEGVAHSVKAVDVTPYTTLTVDMEKSANTYNDEGAWGASWIGLAQTQGWNFAASIRVDPKARNTYTVDISNLSGLHYFMIKNSGTYNGWLTSYIYSIIIT